MLIVFFTHRIEVLVDWHCSMAPPKWTERELLTLAAGVEQRTSHPIARALVQAATLSGCRQAEVQEQRLICYKI